MICSVNVILQLQHHPRPLFQQQQQLLQQHQVQRYLSIILGVFFFIYFRTCVSVLNALAYDNIW